MNLKILGLLLFYWSMWFLVLSVEGSSILALHNVTSTGGSLANISTSLSTTSGGLFSLGVDFAGFIALALFGIGLVSGAPGWIQLLIVLWQSSFTIFTIGWLISSIWNG